MKKRKTWNSQVNERFKEINQYQVAWAMAAADHLKKQSFSFRLYDYLVIRNGWTWIRWMFPKARSLRVVANPKLDLWGDHPYPMAIVDGRNNKVLVQNKVNEK